MRKPRANLYLIEGLPYQPPRAAGGWGLWIVLALIGALVLGFWGWAWGMW